jgi:hypothetical protein
MKMETVTNDLNQTYEVIEETAFRRVIDVIEGRYYDDLIRSEDDLIKALTDAIRMVNND